jgi:hypothetical protein
VLNRPACHNRDVSLEFLAVPTQADNDAERFERIEALIEEYRRKHEDLQHFVATIREQARALNTIARERLTSAKHRLVAAKRRHSK